MNKERVSNNLKQIRELVDKCLKEFGSQARTLPKNVSNNPVRPRFLKTINDHILNLKTQKFFKQPKTAKETHIKLQGVYPCELNRVAVALLRSQKAGELRKTTKLINKKKITAYVW